MNADFLERLCRQMTPQIKEVGQYIRQKQMTLAQLQIDEKGLNSLVSEVDIEAEKRLVDLLAKQLPEAGFLTEEGTISKDSNTLRWVIDPLDGTTNYLHGLPQYCISVALESSGQLVLGIVHDCGRDECFTAWRGGGAWLNDRSIQVSECPSLGHSLLATGFPYHDFEQMANYLKVLELLMQSTRGIRRFGSAALDLAWVACGRFDGFFEYGLNPWDVAAGIILIEEAGGRITDFNDGPAVILGKEILASNGRLHPVLLQEVGERLRA